ncbi:MAG: tetratricopeptide repeat protein [Leptolyngbyaceae cyanobacterium bins.302]|nr:tetratricopeptide repeat protein [Leptolyngbyaceae cyanobacterium bins.302]
MKSEQRSLLFSAGTMPMGAVLLFFAPTVVSAQTVTATPTIVNPVAQVANSSQPDPASSATATNSTAIGVPLTAAPIAPSQMVPASTNLVQMVPSGATAIAPTPIAPNQLANSGQVFLPVTNPQYGYPVASPYPTVIPAQTTNPGGFTVQVTTQIGIPSQGGYPVVGVPSQVPVSSVPGMYPTVQNGYPGGTNSGGLVYGYPGGVYSPTPILTPSQPGVNGSLVEAIGNPALLPLSAQTLWQQIVSSPSQTNAQSLAALQQMVRDYPNFIPAYTQLAQVLIANNRTQEAISTLERGTTLYPNQPELARSLIVALGNSNRWTEAAMTARQFAIRNPNSPLVSEFTKLADESTKLAQSSNTGASPARNSLLGNLLNTGLGYLLTGKITSPVTSSPIGGNPSSWTNPLANIGANIGTNNQATQELLSRVQLLNDAEVSSYINDIGRRLAQTSGRSNFEFYVVRDRDSGAIALPDGKIFVSAGSIANTNSEAELAALIARQMSHSILSHPEQVTRRGNLTSTITRLLPTVGGLVSPRIRDFNNSTVGTLVSGLMGNLSNNLLKPSYTSRMVNDANSKASQLLAAAGYGQGSLVSISTGSDRHALMKVKVQQLLGTSTSWWGLGQ